MTRPILGQLTPDSGIVRPGKCLASIASIAEAEFQREIFFVFFEAGHIAVFPDDGAMLDAKHEMRHGDRYCSKNEMFRALASIHDSEISGSHATAGTKAKYLSTLMAKIGLLPGTLARKGHGLDIQKEDVCSNRTYRRRRVIGLPLPLRREVPQEQRREMRGKPRKADDQPPKKRPYLGSRN